MSNHNVGPFPLHVDSTTGEIIASTVDDDAAGQPSPVPPFSTLSYSAVPRFPLMTIATGGEYLKLRRPQFGEPQPREWRRGTVETFSARSRSRMLQSIAQLDRNRVTSDALFVTFTYPRDWPATVAACKGHLEAFRKRMHRRYPLAWFYWRLEFQQRGAPHFHLLVFGLPLVNPDSLHNVWADVVKSKDKYHVKYGTDVKRLNSWREVAGYCAKYCAKVDDGPQTEEPGRFWGIACRANRPATLQTVEVTDGEFYAIRRLCRRILGASRGYHAPGGRDSGVWVRISERNAKRMLAWAASILDATSSSSTRRHRVESSVSDRPAPGTARNSTDGWRADRQTTIGHSSGSTTEALFDSRDLERRRARQQGWLS